jgi:hypothetical protein
VATHEWLPDVLDKHGFSSDDAKEFERLLDTLASPSDQASWERIQKGLQFLLDAYNEQWLETLPMPMRQNIEQLRKQQEPLSTEMDPLARSTHYVKLRTALSQISTELQTSGHFNVEKVVARVCLLAVQEELGDRRRGSTLFVRGQS